MKLTLYIAAAVLFLVAAVSVYMAFQSPSFVAWIITAMASGMASMVLPSLAPKPFTQEQRDKINQAQEPFRDRPREH